jgi:hypothetical protein
VCVFSNNSSTVFAEPLLSSGRPLWFCYSSFQTLCHISPSVRLLISSSIQTYCPFLLFWSVGANVSRVAGAPTAPAPKAVGGLFFHSEGGRPLYNFLTLVLCSLMEDPTIRVAICSSRVCLLVSLNGPLLPRSNCCYMLRSLMPLLHSGRFHCLFLNVSYLGDPCTTS